jgi:hypothetical protein
MSKGRDNFSAQVSEILKKRAAFICSAPDCKVMTIAPSGNNPEQFQYIGVCAHITAAIENGPRYDPTYSKTKRSSCENGIFLCNNCAAKIDKNKGNDYSVDLLKKWKLDHEKWVVEHLNKSLLKSSEQYLTSSINQIGGITANVVNIRSLKPEKINKANDHDENLFKIADNILNEELLLKVISRLQGDESIMYLNVEKIEELIELFEKPSCIFLNENIEVFKELLVTKLKVLNEFFGDDFDMFPYEQKDLDNFRLCMNPLVNSDRGGDFSSESLQEHIRLKKILRYNCDTLLAAYDFYRKEVKKTLYL